MRAAVIAWYNRRIVAQWYKSYALWAAVIAALPDLIDWLGNSMEYFPAVADALHLQPSTQQNLRLVLLLVVLPALRAWRQKSMTEAAAKQREEVKS